MWAMPHPSRGNRPDVFIGNFHAKSNLLDSSYLRGSSACEQMRVSQAPPQRVPPPGDSLGHLDTGALGRLLAANQAHVQQQASASLKMPSSSAEACV